MKNEEGRSPHHSGPFVQVPSPEPWTIAAWEPRFWYVSGRHRLALPRPNHRIAVLCIWPDLPALPATILPKARLTEDEKAGVLTPPAFYSGFISVGHG